MSHGSLKELFGMSAFFFLIADLMKNYTERNIVPGNNSDQSLYRSELCSLLGNIIVSNAICNLHRVRGNCTVQVGYDSKSALWNYFEALHVNRKNMVCFDLVKAIRHQIQRYCPITYESKWIKAHQDDKKGVLDTWALANIECDNDAT